MGAVYDKAKNFAASHNTFSVQEVGVVISDILKNGKVDYSEKKDIKKIETEFLDKMSRPAQMAWYRFRNLGDTFKPNLAGTIFGVDEGLGEQFEGANIMTQLDLLTLADTPAERHALATSFGMSLSKITDVVERADLARALGVGKTYAAILEKIGIRSIQQLANSNVNTIHNKIKAFAQTEEGQEIVKRRPSKKAIERWIDHAAELPYMIQLTNEDKLPFSVWGFDQLEDYLQARLLWGSNVTLPGNQGVFDAAKLKNTEINGLPSSLPQDLRNSINDIIANPPEHPDYEGESTDAERTSLRRIKLGNKTIGYVATFDVQAENGFEYEGMPIGDYNTFELSVAYDRNGQELDRDSTYW